MTIEASPALNLLTARALLQGSGDSNALENVDPQILPNGALCWVISQQQLYYLDKTSVTPVAPPLVIATLLGSLVPGRWIQETGGGPPSGAAGGQLSGTYPNPIVVGMTESSGPTALAFGAVANGQVLQRSGASVIGVAATFPPNGAAGGQLGGTYPNPDVRGIRETSGPTLLTVGAVADGQFLKRVGATVVGAAAGGSLTRLSNVLFVDKGFTGGGTPDGSIGQPFLTITAALAVAVDDYTILIATGDYTAEGTLNLAFKITLQALELVANPDPGSSLNEAPVKIAALTINTNDTQEIGLNGIQVTGTVTESVTGGSCTANTSNCNFHGLVNCADVAFFGWSTYVQASIVALTLTMKYGFVAGTIVVDSNALLQDVVLSLVSITGNGSAALLVDAFSNWYIVTGAVSLVGIAKTVQADLTP